jgi:hypothetical protein
MSGSSWHRIAAGSSEIIQISNGREPRPTRNQYVQSVGESAGWPLYHVQEMLGHASLEQTSTYLNVQRGGLRESMRKVDEFRTRCNPVVSDGAIDLPVINNHGQKRGAKPLIN